MLQMQVYTSMAVALPGQVMSADDSHYSPVGLIADVALTIGNFAWRKATDASRLVAAGTGPVAGFVTRSMHYAHAGFEAQNTVPAGEVVELLTRGNVAVVNTTDTTVTVGMGVYADQTDGHAIFATTAPESGASATGFKVLDLLDGEGAKDSLVLIGNYNA